MSDALRALPAVDRIADRDELSHLPREAALRAARRALDEARTALRGAAAGDGRPVAPPTVEQIARRARALAEEAETPRLRRIVNATGVLLHTNLGRATLAPAAVRAVTEVAAGHANLEVDEETGGRGTRYAQVARLLCELTGAEDALVVNNNAAATLLPIAATASGREVIISRGQLVEIGGQFRLPDVIRQAGAHLVEVGTTNRTRIGDYEAALTERTALLLRVHPSNFKIVGFTEEASLPELVALGRRAGVAVHDDIGSGALVDLAPFGLTDEPLAAASIAAGADLVWFSGDKLLGGPQAGILVGKAAHVAPLKRHPLTRALRPDKLTLAGLEATLLLYRAGRAWTEIPILRRIARPADDVRAACDRLRAALLAAEPSMAGSLAADVVATEAEVGGGSLPGRTLPSFAVALSAPGRGGADALARGLRQAATPVYGRIERDRVLLDLRAVDEAEEPWILDALRGIL
jgi:L-seryl-tRNA(Ser) seleniumtransferase